MTFESLERIQDEKERQRNWRGTRTIVHVLFVASWICIVFWTKQGLGILWPWYLLTLLTLLSSVILARRKELSELRCGLFSLACLGTGLLASSLSNTEASRAGVRFEPFMGYKLVALMVASVALKPTWIAHLAMGICGTIPLLLYFGLSESFRRSLPVQEPWMTLLFTFIAYWLYQFRLRSLFFERELAKSQCEEVAWLELARAIMAVRDLSNTPLQTLKLASALIKDDRVPRAEIARLSEQALENLGELNRILEKFEKDINWTEFRSFDSMSILKRIIEVEELRSPLRR